MSTRLKQLRSKVRDFALGLPEATEDFPWGERVAKVNKKVFAFLGRDMDPHFGLGVKLRASHAAALATSGAAPMGYGLGKSGWVAAKFEGNAHPSFEQLRAWVVESYAAVAPKKLAAQLVDAGAAKAKPKAKASVAVAKKKPVKVSKRAPVARRAARAAPKSARAEPGKSKSVSRGVRAGKRAPKR